MNATARGATRAPNPVFLREMRQAARLTRTPVILATVTAVAGLVVCSVGGTAITSASPAEVGSVLFHTFFSLAFALVCWVGPGVAALTVASERTGRTWEAVVLTGLPPRSVARGKLLASLTYVGLYIVALAPVGALPFLFGGVTATEVILAFVLLAVFALLSVGFGLAVSSGAASPAMALLVSLPLAVGASLFTYFTLGVGLSIAAHGLWPGIPEGAPVWLPIAYVRADFGFDYLVYLVFVPAVLAVVLALFFHEVTVANLSDANDDRGQGLKRWFIVAQGLFAVVSLLPERLVSEEPWVFVVLATGVCLMLSLFTLFVLSGEPAGPSRRVLSLWARERASTWRRFLGPGMARTALLLVAVTVAYELAIFSVGMAGVRGTGTDPEGKQSSIAAFAAYGACYFAFLAGFATFARTASVARFSPRARLALVLFFSAVGPFFAVAITGVGADLFETSSWLAAPSPLYVFAMMADLGRSTSFAGPILGVPALPVHPTLVPGLVAMAGWAVAGVAFGVVGAARLRRLETTAADARAALDARLALEDAEHSDHPLPT